MGNLEKHSVRRLRQADGPRRGSPRARPEFLNFLEAPSEPWPILLTFRLKNPAHLYSVPHHPHTLLSLLRPLQAYGGFLGAFRVPAVAPNFNWL